MESEKYCGTEMEIDYEYEVNLGSSKTHFI